MLSSLKSKIGNVFLPIHLRAFSNGACTDGAIDIHSGPFNKSFSGFGYEATIEIYNIKVIQELFSKNKNS